MAELAELHNQLTMLQFTFGFGGTHSAAMYFFCSYLARINPSSPLQAC